MKENTMQHNKNFEVFMEFLTIDESLFQLGFVIYDTPDTLDKLLTNVANELLGKQILNIKLEPGYFHSLYGPYGGTFYQIKDKASKAKGLSVVATAALFITGVERLLTPGNDSTQEDLAALGYINMPCEKYPEIFPYPVVFFIPQNTWSKVWRSIPDLFSRNSLCSYFKESDFV
jgi:hypothetical protein